MKKLGEKILLFIILPFVGFLQSFFKPWSSESRIIIFLWFVVFGMCFTPKNKDADSWRYAEEFTVDAHNSSDQFLLKISDYFLNYDTTTTRDIYIISITYLVSRVSSNIHLFFLVLALVFAFFYVKSMKFIEPLPNVKYNPYVIPILFGLFCLSNPIFNINGARFWTAAWIAVFIVFQVLVNKKFFFLLLAPVTVLIHASFLIFIVLIGVYFILGHLDKVWIIVYIISLFFAALSFIPSFDFSVDFLPLFLENEVDAYASDSAILESQKSFQDLPLYARVFNMFPRILINLIVVFLLTSMKELYKNQENKRIMRFMLVLLSFVNFTLVFPSVGVRFFKIVLPFIVFLLIKQPTLSLRIKYLIYLIPLVFIVDIVYWFRHMADVTSLVDYVAPLPYLLYHYLI